MQLEGLMPNVITYAAAVAACRDRPQKVLALLERMRNENIEANTIVLTSAINALARAGGNYTGKTCFIFRSHFV